MSLTETIAKYLQNELYQDEDVAKKHAEKLYNLFDKYKEESTTSEVTNLRADLAGAMGHMEGCGHQWEYLKKKYPIFVYKT